MNTKVIGSGGNSLHLLGQISLKARVSDRLAGFRRSVGSLWGLIVVLDEEGPERW